MRPPRRPPNGTLRATPLPPPSEPLKSKSDISEKIVRSEEKWREFLSFLDRYGHSRFVFRGQSSDAWELRPSAGRGRNYNPLFEERVFRAFKRDARLHTHIPAADDWEWLALGQHFGLPTRLLDWSTNPLVACFFALVDETYAEENAVVYAYPLDQKQIVDSASWPGPFKIKEVGFLFPSSLAPRISSQRGLFSVHPHPDQAWRYPGVNEHRFIIPSEFRFAFQRKLFRMGVDAALIWANLEGVCGSLKWQYDKRLGISAAGF